MYPFSEFVCPFSRAKERARDDDDVRLRDERNDPFEPDTRREDDDAKISPSFSLFLPKQDSKKRGAVLKAKNERTTVVVLLVSSRFRGGGVFWRRWSSSRASKRPTREITTNPPLLSGEKKKRHTL